MSDDKHSTAVAIAAIRLAWEACEGDKALVEVVEAILGRTQPDAQIDEQPAAKLLFDAARGAGAVWWVRP